MMRCGGAKKLSREGGRRIYCYNFAPDITRLGASGVDFVPEYGFTELVNQKNIAEIWMMRGGALLSLNK